MTGGRPASSAARVAITAISFFSGAAGLVYQIVWARQLSLIFGVTTYAVATVLATFVGGLALSSHLFGRLADGGQGQVIAEHQQHRRDSGRATQAFTPRYHQLSLAAAPGLDVRPMR